MNKALLDLLDSYIITYLDNTLVLGRTKEDYVYDVNAAFKRLQKAQIYIKESKYAFFLKKIEFLGHVVSEDSVLIQVKKIDAVRDWPVPTSISELQCFFILENYQHQFV